MTLSEFEEVVHAVMDNLPEWVHAAMHNIEVHVVDDPREVAATENEELLGLYVGSPATERDAVPAGEMPDAIYIFRRPHLALGLTPAALREEIATTLVHEIAHYFGIEDDRLDELGWG